MKKCLFFFFLLRLFSGYSQILDDSTKQVYGPSSIYFVTENNVFKNIDNKNSIDTNLIDFHKTYGILNRYHLQLQTLGNNGTAAQPLYGNDLKTIGRLSGKNAFVSSRFNPETAAYFNTKSPYTSMHYWAGGLGQDLARLVHSQNIKPNLNFFIDIQNFASSKVIGSPKGRDDRVFKSWNVMPGLWYYSQRYQIMANWLYNSSTQVEQGGIAPYAETPIEKSFLYKQELTQLADANTLEKYKNLHLYHQYKLRNSLQVFHKFDLEKSRSAFLDLGADYGVTYFYFNNKVSSYDSLYTRSTYQNIENKIGVKGQYRGFNYRLHGRNRLVSSNFVYKNINTERTTFDSINTGTKVEMYLGAWSAYYFKDSSSRLEVNFENNFLQVFENLKFEANLFTKWIKGDFIILRKSPAFIFEQINTYRANDNSLKNTNELTGNAEASLTYKGFSIKPFFTARTISQHIYLDSTLVARNADKVIVQSQIGLEIGKLMNQRQFKAQMKLSSGDNTYLRYPRLFLSSSYSRDYLYAKKLHMNFGAEAFYISKYYADAYNPHFQVFYLQNQQKVQGFPDLSVFVNVKLSRVRVFVNASNILASARFTSGYFTTPSYVALPLRIGYGVTWPLFD